MAGSSERPQSGRTAANEQPPNGAALDAIAALDLPRTTEAQLLAAAETVEKAVAWALAVQAQILAEFARRRQDDEFSAAEVAATLHLAPRTGARRLQWATELTERLPAAWREMRAGRITYLKAKILAEEAAHLSISAVAAIQDQVLPPAPTQTPSQFRRRVKEAVFRADPDGAQARAELAHQDRTVTVSPLPDGLAEFRAVLPAPDAIALYARLDDLARAADGTDIRTMDQRRADALSDLVYANAGPAARPLVHFILSESSTGDLHAQLAGYGPVAAARAEALIADGVWQRLHADDSGVVDRVAPKKYRPPTALAQAVRARDGTCRFPGCAQPADRCDIDHTIRYPTGATTPDNLATLCRKHHRLKTRDERAGSGWKARQKPHGVLEWTSPTGAVHTTYPQQYGA